MSDENKVKRKYFHKKVGMVFRIDLQEDDNYAYGQVATDVDNIFFDHIDKKDKWTEIEEIIQKPIAFYATVDRYVLKEGLWDILGVWPVKPENQVFLPGFSYNSFLNAYFFYKPGTLEKVFCEPEAVEGRECLSSWGEGSIEQRLRDHFAKRPNYDVMRQSSHHLYPGFPRGVGFPSRKEFYQGYGYNFHWLDDESFGPAELIEVSTDPDVVRGGEQIYIDKQGGAQSTGGSSSNAINAVSKKNPKREQYMEAGKKLLEGD